MEKTAIFLGIALLFGLSLQAQQVQRRSGPVIADFGEVFVVDNPDFVTDIKKAYKVVFDIATSPEDPNQVNPLVSTMARFLNMHAQAGVPKDSLQVACVFHNKATKDVLNSEAYRKRHQIDNPNEPLLKALEEAGVHLYICGQSIHARGVAREELAGPVKLALSAMTILISYQAEGYQLIDFN